MSRTDAHRPPRVHLSEDAVAHHDHSKGECDLPDLDSVIRAGHSRKVFRTRCSWWLPVGYQHEHSAYSKYKGDDRRKRYASKKADIRARMADLAY